MNKAIEFILYSKPECSLCDKFKDELDKKGMHYKIINIEKNSDLKHRYGARIPVLSAGNTDVCEAFFDSQRIAEFLDNHSSISD
jgi:glutaredoxin